MTTRVHREIGILRGFILAVPLILCLAAPLSAASSDRETASSRCQGCSDCAGDSARPRAVGLKIYNQSRLSGANVARILEITNRIWNPYGVNFRPSESVDAIAVVVSAHPASGAVDSRPTVLGDTLFTSGHATPYIHLWPANAEALATGSEIQGRPFTSLSINERDIILVQILGVALAHELAHYLLDTSHHSPAGLLRGIIGVNDLAFPNPAHLRLTHDQQQLICLESRRLADTRASAGSPPDGSVGRGEPCDRCSPARRDTLLAPEMAEWMRRESLGSLRPS